MICLPIVFGIDVKDDFPIFFGSFYKFIYYCNKYKWPIVAQEEYFLNPEIYKETHGINLCQVSAINEIEQINENLFNGIDKYIIKKNETENVTSEFGSKDSAWINLMNCSSKKLNIIIEKFLEKIIKKYKKIDAIIIWRHNKTIEELARKYNIKIIEMELSAIRKPDYKFGLSYFQFSNKYSEKELNIRYDKFKKQTKNIDLPILSRKDILSLLGTKENISNLNEEEYDIGIGLGLQKDYETLSTESPTNEEILKNIINIEDYENILIRKHPANYNYKYENEEKFDLDKSETSLQFVSRCHKIVSSVSNINLEAMILGKTTYTLGKMPFKIFSYNDLKYNDEFVINLKDLNFLIFCYFVPYDLALTEEYISFRLKNPTELDIYNMHFKYLTNKYNKEKLAKKSIREKNTDNKRIKKENNSLKEINKDLMKNNEDLIKENKKIIKDYEQEIEKNENDLKNEIKKIEKDNKQEIKNLNNIYLELEYKYKELINSPLYKIYKALKKGEKKYEKFSKNNKRK